MKTTKHLITLLILIVLSSCVQDTPKKEITVKLDMTNVENASQVGIRGTFPLSWDETTYLQDTDGDGIYEGEFTIYTASNAINFKFVNNDDTFELKDKDNRTLAFEFQPETITIEAVFNDPNTKIIKD